MPNEGITKDENELGTPTHPLPPPEGEGEGGGGQLYLRVKNRNDRSKFFANLLGTSQDRLSGLNSK